jgi:hypothetical protein
MSILCRDENGYLFGYQFFGLFSLIVNKYDIESARQINILVLALNLQKFIKDKPQIYHIFFK